MKTDNKKTGTFGENIALEYLKKAGMKLIERNFSCPLGEIDLIFRENKTLVFVEVKLRKNPFFGPAALAVTPKKQKKIIQTAKYYLQQKRLHNIYIRFDVFGITKQALGWDVQHYPNAFLSNE